LLTANNYAFVKFYSRRSAADAKADVNGMPLKGAHLKVTFAKPRKNEKGFNRNTTLDINRCVELAK
jgi:hypothetical protein